MLFDNVIIHYSPNAECIAKCAIHLRAGNKIVFRVVIKDPGAACKWLQQHNYYKRVRTIVHWGA